MYLQSCLIAEGRIDDVEICALLESVKPDSRTNDNNSQGVHDEDPIKDNEAEGDMNWLNDSSNGDCPCNKEGDTKDKTGWIS